MKINYLKTTFAGVIAAVSLVMAGAVSADSYTVQSGDTLSELAEKYSTTVDEIVAANKIVNADLIHVGQVLEINATTGQETSAQAQTTEAATASSETTAASTTSYTSTATGSEAAAKEEIARRESGGSYTAQNGQYYGRYQLTNTYLNGDFSPENQERVADAYVASRYGSWSVALAFWNANGWY
ncbi:Probable peptidoglycan endopeptidase LytE precursor [Chlamydia trachomatis]|nr:Probable peptidoglycan endopeptidase LytE precursor [Chlamydia trachomatis]CRH90281.1 Probable peptidoglycan endopeptidase LytE precursor [Chlamydia trachomatis]